VRVSVNLTNYSWPGDLTDHLLDVARAADEAGIDTLWVPDHLLQADPNAAPGETEMLEAYTVLGFLAARTERVRLGTMVTGVTFRPPALLVKAVTTVDVLSGGRSWLGIGAGYHAPEAEAMGLFLPPTAERFQRLEETLEIATRLWRGDRSRYDGRHYTLEAPVGDPPPASRPHPPILIGGMGRSTRCGWWPGSATPATSSTSRTAARPSGTSSTCCADTATRSAATTTRSTRRSARGTRRAGHRPRGSTPWPRWASNTLCSSPPARGPRRRSPRCGEQFVSRRSARLSTPSIT
jgi:alkanesulfonate monooxygenase SsuD/methylene tetrahydromethanopterin reductase-like flavin-dependent oxidoreductase (luciferase family)